MFGQCCSFCCQTRRLQKHAIYLTVSFELFLEIIFDDFRLQDISTTGQHINAPFPLRGTQICAIMG